MQSSAGAQQQKVAVFDFDGTSIDGQSGSLFTRYLFSHGMMSPARLARLAWWGIRYKLHLPFRQDEAREVVFCALRGRTSEDVDALMTRFHDEVLAPLYRPQALAEVARCHERGLLVLLVSATFEPIAEVELLRLAMPRRVFTMSQVLYAVDRITWLHENRDLVGGLRWVEEPSSLRFFFGRLEPTSDWQEKLVKKFRDDFGDSL